MRIRFDVCATRLKFNSHGKVLNEKNEGWRKTKNTFAFSWKWILKFCIWPSYFHMKFNITFKRNIYFYFSFIFLIGKCKCARAWNVFFDEILSRLNPDILSIDAWIMQLQSTNDNFFANTVEKSISFLFSYVISHSIKDLFWFQAYHSIYNILIYQMKKNFFKYIYFMRIFWRINWNFQYKNWK